MRGVMEQSRAEFGRVVGAIYDCAIQPAQWPLALEHICQWMGTDTAALMVRDILNAEPKIEAAVGFEPHWLQLQAEHYAQIAPFTAPMTCLRAGQVVSTEDVIDYGVYMDSRFHNEWAAPQGMADALLGVLTRTNTRLGAVGLSFRRRATHEDMEALADLLPHLSRAVAISDLLGFQAAEIARFSAAVDGLSTGVVFVAADLAVLDFNAAAERMLGDRKVVAINNHRLLLPDCEAGRRLRMAIQSCADGRLEDLKTSSAVFESRDGAPALVMHVLPHSKNDASSRGAAVAVVFLTDPEAPVRLPIETLVEQYGLSPSELRVLMGLMQGQVPRAIAEALGIAMPTIRTHLRHLFEKTGTSRQAQLVQLALSMNSP